MSDDSYTSTRGAYPSSISFSCRTQESHANHIIVRNCRTSSFHAIDWFCSRNSRVKISHRSMFSGLTKSQATLMQSARLQTWRAQATSAPTYKHSSRERDIPDARIQRE